MKVILSATALFFYTQINGQVITKAKAYQNTYATLNMYDTTAAGHMVTTYFIMQYDTANDAALNMRVGRLDLNTKDTVSKEINAVSSTSAFWMFMLDSLGNFYVSFNTSGRSVWRFNLRDSLRIDSLGKPFIDQNTLTYSMAIGTDRKVYCGGSSGGTYVSVFDPQTNTFEKFGEVLTNQDYVLNVTGDSEYIYAQVGQRTYNYIVSIRKSDGYKKKIDSVSSATRFDLKTRNDNRINIKSIHGTYILKDTTLTPVSGYTGTNEIYYKNVWVGTTVPTPPGKKNVRPFFNEATNTFSYSTNTGLNNSIVLPAQQIQAKISMVINHPSDTNILYYIGDYYGLMYKYFRNNDSSVVLGKGIGNAYSFTWLTPTRLAVGGYPSGVVTVYKTDEPWLVGTYDSTLQLEIAISSDTTTNPYVLCYGKNIGNAGISHVNQLLYDVESGWMIGHGDVIRVGNGAGVFCYNYLTKQLHGLDFNLLPVGIDIRYISFYQKNKIVISSSGGNAKIWFYNFKSNALVDSIDYDWGSYGKIYTVGELLLGIANNRYFKINMARNHALIYDSILAGQTNYFHTFLPDGRIAQNAWLPPPSDFWRYKYLGNLPLMLNYSGNIGSYYSSYGKTITETKNMVTKQINMNTAKGKEDWVKDILNP